MTVSRFRVASHLLVGLILVGTTLVGCGGSAQSTDLPKKAPISEQEVARTAEPADRGDPSPGSGGGMAAMQRTAQAGKYLFAFFWKAEDEQTLAMRKVFDASNPIQIIGTRHGEKLYETLLTREEMAVAEDMGDYYRVPADHRDLNYELYYDMGKNELSAKDDYNSHNTRRLSLDEMADILNSLDIVKRALEGEKVDE